MQPWKTWIPYADVYHDTRGEVGDTPVEDVSGEDCAEFMAGRELIRCPACRGSGTAMRLSVCTLCRGEGEVSPDFTWGVFLARDGRARYY